MSWKRNTASVGYYSHAWQIFMTLEILKLKPEPRLVSMYS